MDSIVPEVLSTKLTNLYDYKGPLASVFTPFNDDADKSMNLSVIPKYAEFLTSKKANGVLVGGSMGEGTSLSVKERKELTEVWADAVKTTKQHLMVHVGGTALESVKELAAHAESIGADSLLISPDLHTKPNSVDEVVNYFILVSQAAPKTPLLYYHNPTFGVNIDIVELLKTVGEKVPSFGGIKYVTSDAEKMLKAWQVGNQYKLFIGSDDATLAGCLIGMNSMILSTTTLIPELSHKVLEFCHSETDFQLAVDAQDSINKIVKEIDSYGHDTVAMKAATAMVAKIPLGSPRAPLEPLSPESLQSMALKLVELGFEI